MIMRTEDRDVAPKHTSLPWESIDPEETQAPPLPQEAAEAELFSAPLQEEPVDQTVVLERQGNGLLAIAEVGPEPEEALVSEPEDDDKDNDTDGKEEPGIVDSDDSDSSHELGYEPTVAKADGGGWTIAILCIGLALIAACVLIPLADANRRLVYEREKLRLDLDQIQRQTAVNKEFLAKIESDPQLAERLAQRQLKLIRKGEAVLDVESKPNKAKVTTGVSVSAEQMSPFLIVNVPAPAELPEYRPVGGTFADLCRDRRSQLYILGAGMMMVAAGLVLGGESAKV